MAQVIQWRLVASFLKRWPARCGTPFSSGAFRLNSTRSETYSLPSSNPPRAAYGWLMSRHWTAKITISMALDYSVGRSSGRVPPPGTRVTPASRQNSHSRDSQRSRPLAIFEDIVLPPPSSPEIVPLLSRRDHGQ